MIAIIEHNYSRRRFERKIIQTWVLLIREAEFTTVIEVHSSDQKTAEEMNTISLTRASY
eukprot:jgi/Psemu1/300026/fgenesh1_kg.5_\